MRSGIQIASIRANTIRQPNGHFSKYLGIKMELEGYGSSNPVITPKGTIPAGVFHANGNMFTYLFGPQVKFRTPRFQPYGHILFGGGHSNVYANFYTASGVTGTAPAGNCFALSFGGGVDLPVKQDDRDSAG